MTSIRPNRVKQKLAAGQRVLSVARRGLARPDRSDRAVRPRCDLARGRARPGRLRPHHQPDPGLRPVGHDLDRAGQRARLRADLSHPRSRRPGHLRAPHRHRRPGPRVRRGGQVRPARQARHVHQPAGLRRAGLSPHRQRPHPPGSPDRGHQGGAEPRCDPRGRPHRRVLRRTLRSRVLDGQDRQARAIPRSSRPSTRRSGASSPPAGTPAPCCRTTRAPSAFWPSACAFSRRSILPMLSAGIRDLKQQVGA